MSIRVIRACLKRVGLFQTERPTCLYEQTGLPLQAGLLVELERRAGPAGWPELLCYTDTEVIVGATCGDTPAAGALDKAALKQVRLVDVFDRVTCLAQGDGDRTNPHRAAFELLDHDSEVVPVYAVEP